jgi:type IV pilus assembly protein PilM
MVKRPEKTRPKEQYSVKVSLDFTAQSSRDARAFHDKLLQTNDFVDPKGEVRWSTSPGKFHVSFMLKDRTRYNLGGQS